MEQRFIHWTKQSEVWRQRIDYRELKLKRMLQLTWNRNVIYGTREMIISKPVLDTEGNGVEPLI